MEQKKMFLWNSPPFSMIQLMLATLSLVPLPFLNPAWTSVIFQFSFLKSSLENFEHYFANIWNECNCAAVWTFFGIALLWDWNENRSFPVLWPLLSFQICWHNECSTFTASSFRVWNSSAGNPSPPPVLFIVTLPKAYLTSRSLSTVL